MKIEAREANYGLRVDYILSTRGLLPWFKRGDIQPSLMGSDHCPIYVDLHDEITLASGETLKLRDALPMIDPSPDPPRLAAMYWDEYSKQTLLPTFFRKRSSVTLPPDPVASTHPDSPPPSDSQVSDTPTQPNSSEDPSPSLCSPPSSQSVRTLHPTPGPSSMPMSKSLNKGKSDAAKLPRGQLTRKKKSGRSKLSSSVVKPDALPKATLKGKKRPLKAKGKLVATANAEVSDNGDSGDSMQSRRQSPPADFPVETQLQDNPVPYELSQDSLPSPSQAAWSQLFAPVKPPKCHVHGELTKKRTSRKSGPHKGETFFICSRCVSQGMSPTASF
jgi:AP endonuclease-2